MYYIFKVHLRKKGGRVIILRAMVHMCGVYVCFLICRNCCVEPASYWRMVPSNRNTFDTSLQHGDASVSKKRGQDAVEVRTAYVLVTAISNVLDTTIAVNNYSICRQSPEL